MLAKLSVDQALMKAMSHVKKGEVAEAEELYQGILHKFSQNKRAQQGLADLNKTRHLDIVNKPSQEQVNELINLYKAGRFSIVVEQAQALTKQYPDAFMVWNILGASATQIGMADQAIVAFKKVISIKPDDPETYYNIANILKDQEKLDEAVEAYKKSIELKSNHPEAYGNMAVVLQKQGKLDDAIEAYKKSISFIPNYAQTYSNMGNAFHEQGKLDEAIEAHKKCISLNPNYAVAYNNLGNVLEDQEKFDEAIKAYEKAILINPTYADAYCNMGVALKEKGKLDEAIKAYEKAISINPNYADAYCNMGVALKNLYSLEKSIITFKKAILLNSNHFIAYSNMALSLNYQGMYFDAINAYKKSISINPDYAKAHLNLSISLIQSGQIKEGLEEYEWRWKTKEGSTRQRHFPQPLWDGQESLKDKIILLWCEQGIGDTMNWSSCLSLVTARAKHVILECQEKLVPLLKRSLPNVEVKVEDRSKDANRDDFDLHLPMGSLYKHFIDDIIKKGNSDSYLVPDPARVQYWKERLSSIGKGPYIGVSWKSSNMAPNRLQNYLSISDLYPILKMPNLTFINLQYTDYEDDLAKVQDEFGVTIHNFDDIDHFNNLLDVASLVSALDVVISNKTTIPFISAGVGTPTKIANWKQSPWNNILLNPVSPIVKIFERNTWETWQKVINSIANEIKTLNRRG